MPNLQHNSEYERHLTLASLAHCPRDYWWLSQMKAGTVEEGAAGESLKIGILMHVGLAALWNQRWEQTTWLSDLAVEAVRLTPEWITLDKKVQDEVELGVRQYAEQWTGVRDGWTPLAIEPHSVPPEPWTVLQERFVAYPDLIVDARPKYPVLVNDYKTSKWRYEPEKWEYHPELLTQCLAARQLVGRGRPIYYQVDFLQRPDRKSNAWAFPVVQAWEFTEFKETLAQSWIMENMVRILSYRDTCEGPWPQELSQCETKYGMCQHFRRCFPQEDAA